MAPVYRRALVKVSGEALMGAGQFGFDPATLERIAGDIAEARALGVEIAVVVGGGNLLRGATVAGKGVPRATGDAMGMLATVMNALALAEAIEKAGCDARVISGVAMPSVCATFERRAVMRNLEKGRVIVLGGGTGNPFFTTDTTAALRAAELDCDVILKATNVDGIYTADPKKDASATRYDRITHDEALDKRLAVMDTAAFALARESRMPIIVFSIQEKGGMAAVLRGEPRGTLVTV